MQSWDNFDLLEFYLDHPCVLTDRAVPSFLNFHTNTMHCCETEKSEIIIFPNTNWTTWHDPTVKGEKACYPFWNFWTCTSEHDFSGNHDTSLAWLSLRNIMHIWLFLQNIQNSLFIFYNVKSEKANLRALQLFYHVK